ncbi:hypothetical protein M0Q97_09715 [Candidatus Dojkabacteria bacterium]|jgi:hypothetical protein|nr:hypothetical protein [Candidatus Dojkabacteria bacterium]
MKKYITKTKRTISIDKNLNDIMEVKIKNKSKYIEWLIYNDIKLFDDRIKKIII